MKIKSPSLPELHAFVAVARLGSVAKAAEALHVTQGAVSRALQRLEEDIGQPLFDRHRRGTQLNKAGDDFFVAVAPALDSLEAATARAQGRGDPLLLRLSVIPTLASHWLIRRLPRFQALHPEIRLAFVPYRRENGFTFPGMDATLRGGDGNWPEGVEGQYLIGRNIVPVCRPQDLPALAGPRASPSDLLKRQLLFHTSQPDAWMTWSAAMGCRDEHMNLSVGFDQVSQLLEAVVAGLGLAVVQRCLIDDYLESKKLAIAWDVNVANTRAYYFLQPASARYGVAVSAFRKWLVAEAAGAERLEAVPQAGTAALS